MHDVAQITRAIASGDPEAVARLYEARFDFVFRIARARSGFDESGCLDIVQDAFLKAVRSMKVFHEMAVLDAWLSRVVTSVAYDHLRAARRRAAREQHAGRAALQAEIAPGPSEERLAWLRNELSGLDRATAELLELRFRFGMTLTAIGQRVGLAPGAVDGRIRRSLADMRKRAEEHEDV